MKSFIGTYEHNLDAKNRLFLPSDFKELIEGRITVRLKICEHPHIDCFFEEDFEKVIAEEVGSSKSNRSADMLDSMARAYAKTLTVDNGGRICLAKKLLEKAGITKESTFVGKGSFFQIWNPDIYDEYNDYLYECKMEDIAAERAEHAKYNEYRGRGFTVAVAHTEEL